MSTLVLTLLLGLPLGGPSLPPDERSSPEVEEEDGGRHAKIKSSQMFREDEYDGDFIAEDDGDDALGAPEALPLEFSRYGSMKPRELFKFTVEWFVQQKINPAF